MSSELRADGEHDWMEAACGGGRRGKRAWRGGTS